MIYRTDTKTLDFESYSFAVKTMNYEDIPSVRSSSENVINKDGQFIFTDGLNNRTIRVKLTLKENISLAVRRLNAREIKDTLNKRGQLILSYENDVYYDAQVTSSANITFNSTYDQLTIIFTVQPLAFSNIDEDLTWEEAQTLWIATDLNWEMDGLTETFAPGTHTLTNRGNYESLPLYEVTGAGTITIGTESFSVTEKCTVDVENFIVYEGGVNKISSFTGDFITLEPGDYTLTTDVEVKVENKDRWI